MLCVSKRILTSVKFLLKKDVLQHITDSEGNDACDIAKSNGLAIVFLIFNNCNINMKTKSRDILP
jgi:hypothetical protein